MRARLGSVLIRGDCFVIDTELASTRLLQAYCCIAAYHWSGLAMRRDRHATRPCGAPPFRAFALKPTADSKAQVQSGRLDGENSPKAAVEALARLR